jgi:sialate O-acetylesterase
MVVSSSISNQRSTLSNVVVGDVFLFARQSSIDVSLGTTPKGKQAAGAHAADKKYRFVKIKTSPSRTPLDDLKPDATNGWQVVDNKSAHAMSAAAFYLGRDLAAAGDVPIGIVDLDMGYHFPGAWLSEKGLEAAMAIPGRGALQLKREIDYLSKDIDAWEMGVVHYSRDYIPPNSHATIKESEKALIRKPLLRVSPLEMPFAPSVCYNAVVRPLRGLAVKGILLQLGNDYPWMLHTRLRNMGKETAPEHVQKAGGQTFNILKEGNRMTPHVLPAAPDDLRNALGDGTTPLVWIMPPGHAVGPYATHNREIREVQRRTQAKSTAIDLILPGADHIRMSGQPADEALLARRCKQWVMSTFYGARGPASGPVFERAECRGKVATIHFKPGTAQGLAAKGDALKQFMVAAEDGKFVPCRAQVEGNTVKLTSDGVDQIVSVRFGWTLKPVQGLINRAGLPALPFNTDPQWQYDSWPGLPPLEEPEELLAALKARPEGDIVKVVLARGMKATVAKKMKELAVLQQSLVGLDVLLKDGRDHHKRDETDYPKAEWPEWRLTSVEKLAHAPRGWQKPEFDDSGWGTCLGVTGWPSSHVGLCRTTFEIEDARAYESLSLRIVFYKQRRMNFYLNGQLVADVEIATRLFGTSVALTPYAVSLLKPGKNTLAVSAVHGVRGPGLSVRLFGHRGKKN